MSCCFRYLSLLARRTLAVVVLLGYKVRNCYALSVTHFISDPTIVQLLSLHCTIAVQCSSRCSTSSPYYAGSTRVKLCTRRIRFAIAHTFRVLYLPRGYCSQFFRPYIEYWHIDATDYANILEVRKYKVVG